MKGRRLILAAALVAAQILAAAALPQAAHAANTCTSLANGSWSAAGTWTGCGGVIPQTGDDVVINHTVTIDTDTAAVNSVTVSANKTLRFDSNTTNSYTLTVTGDMTINSGATVSVQSGGIAHTVVLGGNLSNSGTFDGKPGSNRAINLKFNKNGDQMISGSGTPTTKFNTIALDKAAATNKVTASIDVSVQGGGDAITWTNGTWEQSAGTLSFGGTNNQSITANGELILSGSGSATFPSSLTGAGGSGGITGKLTVNTTGTLSVGSGNNRLEVGTAGTATLTAGTVNVNGRLTLTSGTTTIDGATINIDPQATSSLGATNDVFSALAAASVSMTAGSITLVDPNANAGSGRDVLLASGAGAKSFTGGTLAFGDGTSSSAGGDGFEVVSGGIALFDVVVRNQQGGTNRTVRLVTNALTLGGSLSINAGGALDANTENISLKGNWTNDGAFTASTRTVTFNGTASQTIGGSATTSFNTVVFDTGSSVTAPAGTLNVAGNWTNRGAFTHNGGTVVFNGTAEQTIGGSAVTTFNNLTVAGGATVKLSGAANADGTVTLAATGAFNANGNDMIVKGNWTNDGTFTAGAGSNISFSGAAAQQIGGASPTTFHRLTINTSGGATVTLATDAAVDSNLSLSGGRLILGANTLTLGAAATIGGSPNGNKMVVADGAGSLCKLYTGPDTAAFTFPIGDATGGANYSPVTLNFTSGAFDTGAKACVRVTDAVQPNVDTVNYPSYLTRYWTATQTGISGFSCDVTFQYVAGDVVVGAGQSEAVIAYWKYEPAGSPQWTSYHYTDATNHLLSGTITGFSDHTGYSATPLAVDLAAFTADATPAGVTLAWETVSETDNAGFNVYRAASEAGPWTRVNAALIPAATPGASSGHAYTWIDATATPTRATSTASKRWRSMAPPRCWRRSASPTGPRSGGGCRWRGEADWSLKRRKIV